MRDRRRIVIAGAAGRDFHNFNTVYRDDPGCEVVAFTAAQIPGIAGRRYPAALAGARYPDGIAIVPEAELDALVRSRGVDEVVLAYSDLAHVEAMHLASRVLAAGADFVLLGPRRTMLAAAIPVIAVSAVRTGAGKSPTVRWLSQRLRARGLRCAVVRHPMPYGDLASQAVQRFAGREDLDRAGCTVEEREEYEPHLAIGNVVYAGIDYARVIALAAREADLLLWDGGNNDFPFVRPDLHVVLADALRPGDASTHHPGEACARMADVIVLSKCDSAPAADVAALGAACRALNPDAPIVRAALPISLERPDAVRGRRVLVIEDGPTLTHGGMAHGAGYLAALRAGARAVVDPRPAAVPEIAALYAQFPQIGSVLPAVGYSPAQLDALRRTIEATDAEVVVAATPADLAGLLGIAKPVVRARYEFQDLDSPGLWGSVEHFLAARGLA
ncbi:MAG: GTPase [Betaproteobacteria bacterium RBG_16_66_20]|nr:MAG: GTPase [Betaproteobacteria bacterium RBG_16_66_20]